MADPLFVLCYDIAGPGARRRVATLLEEVMVRVQESVFEARMPSAAAHALFARAAAMVEDSDRLRLYAVGAAGTSASRVHGGPPIAEFGHYWLL